MLLYGLSFDLIKFFVVFDYLTDLSAFLKRFSAHIVEMHVSTNLTVIHTLLEQHHPLFNLLLLVFGFLSFVHMCVVNLCLHLVLSVHSLSYALVT